MCYLYPACGVVYNKLLGYLKINETGFQLQKLQYISTKYVLLKKEFTCLHIYTDLYTIYLDYMSMFSAMQVVGVVS